MNEIVKKYILLCIFTIATIFLNNVIFDSRELIYSSLADQLDETRIKAMISLQEKIHCLSYFILPVMLILKLLLFSTILYIGIQLGKKKESFRSILLIVLNAEFITLIGIICSILYFWISGNYHTFADLSTPPFSVLALFNPSEVEPWLRYPFSLLNIFEVFYWVALIVQWKKLTGKTYGESFDFIGSTYGLGLLLWVLVVIFFTI